jgi:hypothetical protein
MALSYLLGVVSEKGDRLTHPSFALAAARGVVPA